MKAQISFRGSVLLLVLFVAAVATLSAKDAVHITKIPPVSPGGADKMDHIAGTVTTDCGDCSIVLFALGDVWYVQPWAASPYTNFDEAGKWGTDIHLGSEYAALLVHRSYQPPARTQKLPEVGGDILASVHVSGRQASATPAVSEIQGPKILSFAGRNWTVKTSEERVGPGPNVFSARNAWVDTEGRLHLKIAKEGNEWTSAEVVNEATGLGYGSYKFTVGDTSTLPPSAVLGLFTWETAASEQHNRELDIEVSRWTDPANANCQFVVQPYNKPENIVRFEIPAGRTSHDFVWTKGVVAFRSKLISSASNQTIQEHTFRSGVPAPGNEQIRINLWLVAGQSPQGERDVEVTIDNFEFSPQTASK